MKRTEAIAWLEVMKEDAIFEQYDALRMAIEALFKPNYESDNEVRLAVTNRKKEKVILWDAFGEVEYYPTTNDRLINADALILLLKARKQFFIDSYGGSFHTMSEKDKARCDEIDACIASIINAPTLQVKQREEPQPYDEDDFWNDRVSIHDRLINASWVINEIHKNICDMCEQGIDIEDCNDCKIEKIKRIIYSAPTPSTEVEQGEWICKGDYAVCSKCGGSSGTQFDGVEPIPRTTAFCPHCGRRMKGAEHEID